ncbi:glycosyltransferase [Aquimarina muelleri]|uniref:Glycosyl transferase n=1 Tax=Aquimarina muelleri TaxID=279356 RepID=A0A918N3H9_9FLAO|nr:glycosyltransferase [Aquimarina muelleri]MCX2763931.1 glycosyltransferase [Aquimarina muelleri]GGX11190.1 glycosyl transferase [Aquimarina muelleri]
MATNEILMITSFPPRKCGIATYSQDLIKAIEDKYSTSFTIKVCALKKKNVDLKYPNNVKYVLKTWSKEDYNKLAQTINLDKAIKIIYLQHEFGLYEGHLGDFILDFLDALNTPVVITFHTVLAHPEEDRKVLIQKISELSSQVIVMTHLSAEILKNEYKIPEEKIKIIAHGTHLIKPLNLREIIPFKGKTILSTFGLISEGKGIETALEALPRIIAQFPDVLYLIIGKTHPEVIKKEGEVYRNNLHEKVKELNIENNVIFINKYLALDVLLEYLRRTDLYFFTSKDPQQAVSGTLVYALSAACPVISTPIPHALELLDGAGINFDFGNARQLADATILALSNTEMMKDMQLNALHRISPTAWQNAAIAHIDLAKTILKKKHFQLNYKIPDINLLHIKRMTTGFGMIQFANIANPDLASGYTLDDNARALIAVAKHFELTGKFRDLPLINIYLKFILFCQQEDGTFLNYVTYNKNFFDKNKDENLEDANGRAIWALGEFLSLKQLLDFSLQAKVENAFQKAIHAIHNLESPRAIAFCIKGLCFYYHFKKEETILQLIIKLADNLASKYRGVSDKDWQWYEDYLTYGNAVIPEAMLLAAECTNNELFKDIAHKTFEFLLETTFNTEKIKVISNQGWHHKGKDKNHFGEQPIEIAYTILALDAFFNTYKNNEYLDKMKIAFNWFLGENHLHQIIYNPVTGGCYDGLEEHQVNLNQGAESTVSYLLARLTVEKHSA